MFGGPILSLTFIQGAATNVFHREAAIRAMHNYRVSRISQVQFVQMLAARSMSRIGMHGAAR